MEVLLNADIDGSYSRDDEGNQNHKYPDTSLQVSIELERFAVSVNQPAEVETPQRQSAHEGCQYRGCGKGRAAKHENEHLLPDDFVDQSACAGKEEEDQYDGLNVIGSFHWLCLGSPV